MVSSDRREEGDDACESVAGENRGEPVCGLPVVAADDGRAGGERSDPALGGVHRRDVGAKSERPVEGELVDEVHDVAGEEQIRLTRTEAPAPLHALTLCQQRPWHRSAEGGVCDNIGIFVSGHY